MSTEITPPDPEPQRVSDEQARQWATNADPILGSDVAALARSLIDSRAELSRAYAALREMLDWIGPRNAAFIAILLDYGITLPPEPR